MAQEERSVREFLVSLPRLANDVYNEAVSFTVWQTLEQCVTQGVGNINWQSQRAFFQSPNWQRGVYDTVRLPSDWRDAFFNLTDIIIDGVEYGHRGSSCSRICKPTETVFYCFDCTRNPLYELCGRCFDPLRHTGHRYTSRVVTRPEGRVCHCGDSSGLAASSTDYAITNKCRNAANNVPRHLDYLRDSDSNLIDVFEQVLDYIIDTTVFLKELSEASNKTVLAHDDETPEIIKDEYVLQLYDNDSNLHVKDLVSKISLVLDKPIEFSLMMTECLQKGDPFIILAKSSDAAKLESIREGFAMENINLQLKTTTDVFKEYLVDELTNWLYKLCLNNPSLCLKMSLRVAMCGIWRPGLLSTKYSPGILTPFATKIALLGGFVVPFEQRDTFPWPKPWLFPHPNEEAHDPNILRIMQHYDGHLKNTNTKDTSPRFSSLEGSRFQNLLVQGTTLLPKIWRCRLLKIVSCIFTIVDDSRNCMAAQYIDIYPNLLYNTVASDSIGYKLSLMSSLSQLIFQIPKIANLIIPSGFIERVIQVAFTLMAFSPEDLVECPPVPLYRDFKLPNDAIKNKRSVICFKDVYLVMSTNTVPEVLLSSESILRCVVNCFAAFNNVLSLRRETSEHVEFENFEFSSYYFYFSSILVMVDGYTRNICLLRNAEERTRIVRHFLETSMIKEFELLRTSRQVFKECAPFSVVNENIGGLRVFQETICNTVSDVIDFKVGVACQSFFNPMSYFFKFVTLWSQCGRYEPLPYAFNDYLQPENVFDDKRQINWMCESALSTLVLLAQVNAGFWVRNGSPIQHQARMYTKYSMREFTYFSDIYMVQLAMSIADPNNFLVTYLTRWGLKSWAQGIPIGDYPETEITTSMADQSLLLLIQLFSEVRSLAMKSSIEGFEKTMQAEIVHALCFKNSTHSDLLNSIPEHVTKHPAFELYLHEIATYTPPNELMDAGIYTLKKEHFSSVDPYFVGYSSSKRYEAEKLVRNNMASSLHCEYDQTFVTARECTSKLRGTPFSNLYQISGTELFGNFIKNTLDHIGKLKHEVMLGKVTHLIHLCVLNNVIEFSTVFWREYGSSSSEYLHYSSIGSLLYSFLSKDEFVNEHGKIREIFRYISEKAPHNDVEGFLSEQTPSLNFTLLTKPNYCGDKKDEEFEKRKRLAKSKRLKLMKRIAKQQRKFLANNKLPLEEEPCKSYDKESIEEDWILPEAACVFCKMEKGDDTFVYFSYLEKNICGKSLNPKELCSDVALKRLGEKQQIREGVSVQPVLRTCGHGSHESCLTSHMKSMRAVHNHITKNVPRSFGFSLMFCPLCSALTNSFLPRLRYIHDQPSSASFALNDLRRNSQKNGFNVCNKAMTILHHLINKDGDKNMRPIEVLCKIYANTVKNAEVASRKERKGLESEFTRATYLNNHHLITLKLLSQMRNFFVHNYDFLSAVLKYPYAALPTAVDFVSWEKFIGKHQDTDLFEAAIMQLSKYSPISQFSESFCISEYVKKSLHQDIIATVRGLTSISLLKKKDHDIFRCEKSRAMLSESVTDEEANLIAYLLKCYFSAIGVEFPKNIGTTLGPAMRLLRNSMTVRMRRLAALLYSEGLTQIIVRDQLTNFNNLDFLLKFCGMPNFAEVLNEYSENTMRKVVDVLEHEMSMGRKDSFMRKVDNRGLYIFEENSLIELPKSYSELMDVDNNYNQMKSKKEELAVCLFCGDRVHVQNAVALQNYTIGECTDHCLYNCPVKSIYGCFLMVMSNTVYLSYGYRGTFYQAPFMNSHGETDEDYRSGSPVFLNKERYLYLSQDIILGNMVPHLVFRLTDNNSDLGGWESM
ncbi:LANO_0E14092g1_1 [Lachancea nothofagi CBS 11611]|uniref:E3 ubiquitin-protein ligase n=1 Tax=Lachancea nothofagi CBS 11611 TaxID=1266666 RepID=A0A1G4JZM9_9SACH|nr:LANO_0E14092g1_1 [Lachancea nothofagi CBS 11611]